MYVIIYYNVKEKIKYFKVKLLLYIRNIVNFLEVKEKSDKI